MKTYHKILIITLMTSLAFAEKSEVAESLGYTNLSEKVSAGPYILHYGESDNDKLYLLARACPNRG
jgi:hypothetical protein